LSPRHQRRHWPGLPTFNTFWVRVLWFFWRLLAEV